MTPGRPHRGHRLGQVHGQRAFAERGAVIVDADAIVRDLQQPGARCSTSSPSASGRRSSAPTASSTGRPRRPSPSTTTRPRRPQRDRPSRGPRGDRPAHRRPRRPPTTSSSSTPRCSRSSPSSDFAAVIVVDAPIESPCERLVAAAAWTRPTPGPASPSRSRGAARRRRSGDRQQRRSQRPGGAGRRAVGVAPRHLGADGG